MIVDDVLGAAEYDAGHAFGCPWHGLSDRTNGLNVGEKHFDTDRPDEYRCWQLFERDDIGTPMTSQAEESKGMKWNKYALISGGTLYGKKTGGDFIYHSSQSGNWLVSLSGQGNSQTNAATIDLTFSPFGVLGNDPRQTVTQTINITDLGITHTQKMPSFIYSINDCPHADESFWLRAQAFSADKMGRNVAVAFFLDVFDSTYIWSTSFFAPVSDKRTPVVWWQLEVADDSGGLPIATMAIMYDSAQSLGLSNTESGLDCKDTMQVQNGYKIGVTNVTDTSAEVGIIPAPILGYRIGYAECGYIDRIIAVWWSESSTPIPVQSTIYSREDRTHHVLEQDFSATVNFTRGYSSYPINCSSTGSGSFVYEYSEVHHSRVELKISGQVVAEYSTTSTVAGTTSMVYAELSGCQIDNCGNGYWMGRDERQIPIPACHYSTQTINVEHGVDGEARVLCQKAIPVPGCSFSSADWLWTTTGWFGAHIGVNLLLPGADYRGGLKNSSIWMGGIDCPNPFTVMVYSAPPRFPDIDTAPEFKLFGWGGVGLTPDVTVKTDQLTQAYNYSRAPWDTIDAAYEPITGDSNVYFGGWQFGHYYL